MIIINDEVKRKYRKIRRRLHRIPELALEETKTQHLLMEELKELGFEPEPIGDTTGVTAMIRGAAPGPVIALRADMDGLPMTEESGLSFASEIPGHCHACGHDLHMTMVLLAAQLLLADRKELRGSVKLIFQPGEEGQKGCRRILQEGILENPRVDYIIGAHTMPELDAGRIGVRYGAIMAASDRMRIRITGKGGHGAHPQDCVDPVMAAVHVIDALQTIVSRELNAADSAIISIGSIHGGSTFNVIPSEVVIEGTIRTLKETTRSWIRERILAKAQAAAAIEGAQVQIEFLLGIAPTINTDALVDLVREAGRESLGEEQVAELVECDMCGEDFAGYLQQIPGVFFRVGTGNEYPCSRLPLHSSRILFDEEAIFTGAAVMAETVKRMCR